MKKYRVLIEKDEDGCYVASALSISGCHTQGDTFPDTIKYIREAIELCVNTSDFELEVVDETKLRRYPLFLSQHS